MPDTLRARVFSESDLPLVATFECGTAPWALAASLWIRTRALASMADRGTRIWLYFDEADNLAGFSAIGATQWPECPDRLAIVVQLAVCIGQQGKRYSSQIIEDSILRARELDTEWLVLTVDPGNTRAVQLYKNHGFETFDGLTGRGHCKMQRKLK